MSRDFNRSGQDQLNKSQVTENSYISFTGDLPNSDQQNGFVSLFQPSMPFPLENGDKIFFRPAIPIIHQQPIFNGTEFKDKSGLGNIGFDLSYAPRWVTNFNITPVVENVMASLFK